MKRLIAIALVVALAVTALAVAIPVGAQGPPGGNKAVFESDIIDIPEVDGMYTDELTGGEVYVRENGDVKVEITGATAGKTYFVVIQYGPAYDPIFSFLGFMTEYDDGEYKLETSLFSADPELLPIVGAPVFVIIDSEEEPQFANGFYMPE